MSLKKNWERLAFGTNSSGKKSTLLREFRDTSIEEEQLSDTQMANLLDTGVSEDEDASGTPGELVATVYTMEGLEDNVDGELSIEEIQALQMSPSLIGGGDGSPTPTESPEAIIEEIAGRRNFRKLVNLGLLSESPVVPQGTNQEMGGQRGVLYVLDALTDNHGGWTINPLVNVHTTSQGTMKAWASAPGHSPSSVTANGSNNRFTNAMNTEYPPGFQWGTPGGMGDVIVGGEYYELKASKNFKTLKKNGSNKRKNKKFGKELTRAGMGRIGSKAHREMMNGNNPYDTSVFTNQLTRYVCDHVWGPQSIETKVFMNPTNIGGHNGWGDMSKSGGKSGGQAFCTSMVQQIANSLQSSPNLLAGLYTAWATAQGLYSATPENLLIPGWDVGMISAVSIPELKTVPAAGMWDVSQYNSAGSSSQPYFKCRPMVDFTFAAWNLASCTDKTIGGRNAVI